MVCTRVRRLFTPEDLKNVSGIGDKNFEKLKGTKVDPFVKTVFEKILEPNMFSFMGI